MWQTWECFLVFHCQVHRHDKNPSVHVSRGSIRTRRKNSQSSWGLVKPLNSAGSFPGARRERGRMTKGENNEPCEMWPLFHSHLKLVHLSKNVPHVTLVQLPHNHQNIVFQEHCNVHRCFWTFQNIFNPFSPIKTGSYFCQLFTDSIMKKKIQISFKY